MFKVQVKANIFPKSEFSHIINLLQYIPYPFQVGLQISHNLYNFFGKDCFNLTSATVISCKSYTETLNDFNDESSLQKFSLLSFINLAIQRKLYFPQFSTSVYWNRSLSAWTFPIFTQSINFYAFCCLILMNRDVWKMWFMK